MAPPSRLRPKTTIPIAPSSHLSPGNTDMPSVTEVSGSHVLVLSLSGRPYAAEDDPTPAPVSSSSAVTLRDQDGTVATLKDSAAGVPRSLHVVHSIETLLSKANSYNHARSGASKRAQDSIPLASFSKDGVGSREAMAMITEIRMPEQKFVCTKICIQRYKVRTSVLRLVITLEELQQYQASVDDRRTLDKEKLYG